MSIYLHFNLYYSDITEPILTKVATFAMLATFTTDINQSNRQLYTFYVT